MARRLVSVAEELHDATEAFELALEGLCDRLRAGVDAADRGDLLGARGALVDVEIALRACVVEMHDRNVAALERAQPEVKA